MKKFWIFALFLIVLSGLFFYSRKAILNSEKVPTSVSTAKSTSDSAFSFTPETKIPVTSAEIPLLEQMNQEYVKVARAVLPSVVNVFTSRPAQASGSTDDNFNFPFSTQPTLPVPHSGHRNIPAPRDTSLGSGVIIGREGYIITNGHVVKDADEISVQLWDNRKFTAKIVGQDDPADIAVLKIEADHLQPLPWGNSDNIQIGEQVIAIGNPFGLSESISNGIVSAKGRNPGFGPNNYEDFIQTNAAINPGNSGGALVNIRGELIGINTAIASTNRGFQGIGFALPSNLARFVIESLIKSGRVIRGYLGVTIQEIKPDLQEAFHLPTDSGALITEVASGSPAAKSGLQRGDVITKLGDQSIDEPAQLRLAISQTPIGQQVDLTVLRFGKSIIVPLKIAELPMEAIVSDPASKNPTVTSSNNSQENNQNVLAGIKVQNIDDEARKHFNLSSDTTGAIVTSVEEGSFAEAHGIQPGDAIEEVRLDGNEVEKINDAASFFLIAKKLKPNQNAVLLVRHAKATSFVYLPAK